MEVLIKEGRVIYKHQFEELLKKTTIYFDKEIEDGLKLSLKVHSINKNQYDYYMENKDKLILSKSRLRCLVNPRQFLCYFLYLKEFKVTLKTLASWLNKDHSTVIYYRDSLKEMLKLDKKHSIDFYTTNFNNYLDFIRT